MRVILAEDSPVWRGVHLPSKKTNSLVGGSRGECRDACSQAGRERLHMWCVAQPTDRVRVCCVSSTEAVSTQCHTRSGCSHQGVQSKSVYSALCVLLLWGWCAYPRGHHLQSAVLLNVVVRKSACVEQVLRVIIETQRAMPAGYRFHFRLDILYGVRGQNGEGPKLPPEGHVWDFILHVNLHSLCRGVRVLPSGCAERECADHVVCCSCGRRHTCGVVPEPPADTGGTVSK